MDASEIKDAETLEAWLDTRPQSDSVIIAHRIALRLTPVFYVVFASDQAPLVLRLAINSLRSLLTSGVAADAMEAPGATLDPTIEVLAFDLRVAALQATSALFGTTVFSERAGAAVEAAKAAVAKITNTATDPENGAFKANRHTQSTLTDEAINLGDIFCLQSGINPLTLPLWHNEAPPDWFTTAEAAMRTYWQTQNPTHWAFWQRWYDAAVAGRPLDWTLQEKIALIPNDIWQSGPEAVAKEIAKIEGEHRNRALSGLTNPDGPDYPAPGRRAVQTKLIAAQITVLEQLVAAELEFLRGHNGWSSHDLPKVEEQRKPLEAIRDLVAEMLSALEGNLLGSTALTVIDQNLPAIVEKAEELEKKANQPQVSAEIYAIAAAVKVLTESGVPGDVAAKIAYAEEARGFFKRLFRRWK